MTLSGAVPASAKRRRDSSPMAVLAVLAACLVLLPLTGVVYPYDVMQALCFALFASAFNLLLGYVGLLSFGHAMFLGTAGYACAHAAKVWALPPEVAILFGTLCAGLLGALVGLIAIRRQGIYFSMTTLALAQMIYFFYLQSGFTHGEDGIQGVPQGKMFGLLDLSDATVLYYVVVAVVLIGVLIIYRTINSPFGEVLKAVRENEPRAISLGYKTERYKTAAFTLSAALAGLAGALKVIVAQNATLTDVHWTMSGEVVLMVLLGGLGTIFGPILGAFIIIYMQLKLSTFGQWVMVIQGGIFVACVLAFRRGIIGEIAHRLRRSL